jgi:hypothetical protein
MTLAKRANESQWSFVSGPLSVVRCCSSAQVSKTLRSLLVVTHAAVP